MKRRQRRSGTLRVIVTLALLVLGLAMTPIGRHQAALIERVYARALFPKIAGALTGLSGWTHLDLAEWFIVLGVPLALSIMAAAVRRAIRTRSLARGFGSAPAWLAGVTVAVWCWQLLWGLCYSRPPLAARLGFPETEVSPAPLVRLLDELAVETNTACTAALNTGELSRSASASRIDLPLDTVAADLARTYAPLFPATNVRAGDPKFPRVASWIMTRVGISGFYFPLTGEASVNRMMPEVARPFTMAHEMAHQRGIAPEGEANFLAYLACRESRLASVRYSGALHAYGLVANALYAAAPDSMRSMARRRLDAGPGADQEALSAFWRRYQGRVHEAAERVNDTYLRANAQAGGIRTYGLAVDLLLAWEAARGG